MCAIIELNGQICAIFKVSRKVSRQAYKRSCWTLPWRTERTWKLALQLLTVCYKLGKLSFGRPLLRVFTFWMRANAVKALFGSITRWVEEDTHSNRKAIRFAS